MNIDNIGIGRQEKKTGKKEKKTRSSISKVIERGRMIGIANKDGFTWLIQKPYCWYKTGYFIIIGRFFVSLTKATNMQVLSCVKHMHAQSFKAITDINSKPSRPIRQFVCTHQLWKVSKRQERTYKAKMRRVQLILLAVIFIQGKLITPD